MRSFNTRSTAALVMMFTFGCGKVALKHHDGADDQDSTAKLTPGASHEDDTVKNTPPSNDKAPGLAASNSPEVPAIVVVTPPENSGEEKSAAAHPDPASVSILSAQFAGTACPVGSTGAAELNADLTELKITWPAEVNSEIGPGVSLARSRKQCSVSVIFALPTDWVYRLTGVETRATSRIDLGITAKTIAQAYFQGSAITTEFASDRVGPLNVSDIVTGAFVSEWSPLNLERALNLKLESRLQSDPTAGGGIHGSNIVNPESKYALEWENRVPVPVPVP